jgi:hypothetical protein
MSAMVSVLSNAADTDGQTTDAWPVLVADVPA